MSRMAIAIYVVLQLTASPVEGQRAGWWQDVSVQQELELTPPQVIAIERVYDATLKERIALRKALHGSEQELESVLARGDYTDDEAAALVGRLSDLRKRRNIVRTLMLFQMYRELSPRQRRILSERHGLHFR